MKNRFGMVKILSIVGVLGGMAATLLCDWASEQIMEETINEKVEAKFAELNGEEAEEES